MERFFKTQEVKDSARVVRRAGDKRALLEEGAISSVTKAGDTGSARWVAGRCGPRRVEVAPVVETERRAREVRLLINVIEPDPELQAFLVTDEASALDVSPNVAETVRARLEAYLGRPLSVDLRTPLWEVVDAIRAEFPYWPDVWRTR